MVVSFWEAEQLLALATLLAARHAGVTLDDVIERFSVSKRTAQRMMRALESQFTDTNVGTDGEGRKRWHLPSGGSDRLQFETACRRIGAPHFRLRRTSSSGADHG